MMFRLKRLCFHIKGENNNLLVEGKCVEMVGKHGETVVPYPKHCLLGTF
jgi:hypothetical protein